MSKHYVVPLHRARPQLPDTRFGYAIVPEMPTATPTDKQFSFYLHLSWMLQQGQTVARAAPEKLEEAISERFYAGDRVGDDDRFGQSVVTAVDGDGMETSSIFDVATPVLGQAQTPEVKSVHVRPIHMGHWWYLSKTKAAIERIMCPPKNYAPGHAFGSVKARFHPFTTSSPFEDREQNGFLHHVNSPTVPNLNHVKATTWRKLEALGYVCRNSATRTDSLKLAA